MERPWSRCRTRRRRSRPNRLGRDAMSAIIRVLMVIGGVLLMLGGLAALALPGVGAIAFLQLFGFGAVLVLAVALERQRYRSAEAERSHGAPGPGGGEPPGSPLDSRFR